jgi:hypothetical protein
MISTTERRQNEPTREHARIPCAIPVELTHDERTPGFPADAVDLSAGGLSLRSSSLPEVGATLHCHFDTLPGGTRISGRGEVVWAKLSGERSGEFGLRFTHIEPRAQALIAEMIAERVATGTSATPRQPRMATLEFEEAEGPITAKLTRATGHDVVFEQPLDVLALGRTVVAHADKTLGHGNILRVDLRMDRGTPTLALTVRFSQSQEEYGEYDWGEPNSHTQLRTADPERVAAAGGPGEVDTVPDLAAPLGVHEERHSQLSAAQAHLTEATEDTEPDAHHPSPPAAPGGRFGLAGSHEAPPPKAKQMDLTFAPGEEPDEEHDFANADDYELHSGEVPAVRRYEAIAILDEQSISSEGTHTAPPSLRSVDAGDSDADPEVESRSYAGHDLHGSLDFEARPDGAASEDVTDSARKSALVRFLRIFAALIDGLQTTLGFGQRALQRASDSVLPAIRRTLSRRGTLRGVGVGVRRRTAGTATTPALPQKFARSAGVATPAATPKPAPRGTGRLILLALLMLGCGVLLVYALSPQADHEHVDLHRTVQLEAESAAAAPAVEPATDALPEAAAAVGGSATASVRSQLTAAAPGKAGSKLTAATTGSRAALAVDEKALAAGMTTFGQKQVANGQRYLLRMSAPITAIHGKSDPGGFTVIIPGNRAVDRAAPIALTNRAVSRAKILNKGGYAELTVRFAEGKSPAYRVTAQQAGLEVLIAQ